MSPRSYGLTWWFAGFGALAMVAILVVGDFQQLRPSDCVSIAPQSDTEIFVIGSSLTAHAFAQTPANSNLLGDGSTHVVWARGNIDAEDTLFLVNCALALDPRAIFVESNALGLVPLRSTTEYPNQLAAHLLKIIAEQLRNIHLGFRSLVVAYSGSSFIYTPKLHNNPSWVTSDATWDGSLPTRQVVPFPITDASALRELAQLSAQHSAKILLFEPPRTTVYSSDIGASLSESYEEHMSGLSNEAGVPIFRLWGSWPNSFFADYMSHLNTKGRARFQREWREVWIAGDHAS